MSEKKFNFRKKNDSLPHSPDAEKGILSCILQNPDELIPDCVGSLDPEHFYHPSHRLIYEEALSFNKPDRKLDLVTFSQHMIDKGLMDQVGGPAFLAELLSFLPTTAHYPYYKGILRDKLVLRRCIEAGTDIIQRSYEYQEDMADLEKAMDAQLAKVKTAISGREQGKSWEEEVDGWMDRWQKMASGSMPSAIRTRWDAVNDRIAGLPRGYIIFSGASSSGKSSLMSNAVSDVVFRDGGAGAIFSYEMSVQDVIGRIISDLMEIEGYHIFNPDVYEPPKDVLKLIGDGISKIRKAKLHIEHNVKLSADGICHKARKLYNKFGPLVIAVDYLQLLPRPPGLDKQANREREIALNSQTLQALSKEIACPVIALSQLNNDGTTRESQAINNDCDLHLKVDREVDPKTGKIIRDKGIRIYKNRNGPSGFNIPLHLEGRHFRFVEKTDQ